MNDEVIELTSSGNYPRRELLHQARQTGTAFNGQPRSEHKLITGQQLRTESAHRHPLIVDFFAVFHYHRSRTVVRSQERRIRCALLPSARRFLADSAPRTRLLHFFTRRSARRHGSRPADPVVQGRRHSPQTLCSYNDYRVGCLAMTLRSFSTQKLNPIDSGAGFAREHCLDCGPRANLFVSIYFVRHGVSRRPLPGMCLALRVGPPAS